jgi:hypothetical protein
VGLKTRLDEGHFDFTVSFCTRQLVIGRRLRVKQHRDETDRERDQPPPHR